MRRVKQVAGILGAVGVAVVLYVWIVGYYRGRVVDRCFEVRLGQTRAEVDHMMRQPGLEYKDDGRTAVAYRVPAWYDTEPTIWFDAGGRVVEIVCDSLHRSPSRK